VDIGWKEYQKDVKSLLKEERDGQYCSANIIRVMKSSVMRWVGHVACMGEYRTAQMF
jgi:hypothetical protein